MRESVVVLDTDTVAERVKGRVVGIPEREREIVPDLDIDTDLERVGETEGVRVLKLEGLTVVAPDRERVRDTDRVLDTDTVAERDDRLEGLTVVAPEREREIVPDLVIDTDLERVGETEGVRDANLEG
mgnify:CR=1 FL=1